MTQTLDEILRHAVREIASAMDETHAGCPRSQKHRCLTRGIPSADHHDLLILASAGLEFGGGVIKPGALEAVLVGHAELAVPGARRNHDRAPQESRAVVQG